MISLKNTKLCGIEPAELESELELFSENSSALGTSERSKEKQRKRLKRKEVSSKRG